MTDEVWKDATVVARFADARAARVPEAATQLAVLLHVLRGLRAAPERVLDLGAGDAVLLGVLLDAFPGSVGVAVDFSPPMRARAVERLRVFGARGAVVSGDLASPAWRNAVAGPFDVVVSGFAIHHLPDARKRALYAEVFELLASGGVFLNLEHVASATPRIEALSDEAFVAHQYGARRAAGEAVTVDEVRREFAERPDRLANILAPVEAQCAWLRALGFVDVDCFWKHFELALFGGFRPGPAACSSS